jgi:hypothetical protein
LWRWKQTRDVQALLTSHNDSTSIAPAATPSHVLSVGALGSSTYYLWIGCYTEAVATGLERTFSNFSDVSYKAMTVEMCWTICSGIGTSYFGLEYRENFIVGIASIRRL